MPALHTPAKQCSFLVQKRPSSQAAFLFCALTTVQLPAWQLLTAQLLPASQGSPSLMGVATQPIIGSQVPVTHSVVSASQSPAPGVHEPALH